MGVVGSAVMKECDEFGMFGTRVAFLHIPWKSKTKQRMVFRMIHVFRIPDPTNGQNLVGLDFLGIYS